MNTKTIFAVLKNPKDYRYHAIGMPINIKELIGRDITDEEIKEMPHAETLYIMKLMDGLRAKWDARYPMD